MATDIGVFMQTVHVPGPGRQYVNPSTGNDANSGSASSRKRTIAAAIAAMPSGGIVWCANGSYGNVTINGNFTNSAWVLVMAENRFGPLATSVQLTGSYVGVYGFTGNGGFSSDPFLAYQAHHVAVWGCDALNGNGVGIGGAGNNSSISNVSVCYNLVRGNASQSIWAGSGISFFEFTQGWGSQNHTWLWGYDNVFVGNIIHSNTNPPNALTQDGNGLIIDDMHNGQTYAGARRFIPYTGNFLVLGNFSFNNGGVGLHAFASDNVDIMFNTTAMNNQLFGGGVEIDTNDGNNNHYLGNAVRPDVSNSSTWFGSYASTNYTVEKNVVLAGSQNTGSDFMRTADGYSYFKNNAPTLTPTAVATLDQWRPDGGSGAVQTVTISQAQYDKWSHWLDVFGDTRPTNRVWACGATEAAAGGGGPLVPVANFTYTPTTIVAGQTVTFTDTSTNTPTSWAWDFGDGTGGTAPVDPVGITGSFDLLFEDTFTGSALDTTKWESSWYGIQAAVNGVATRPGNVAVTGGNLVLTLANATEGATITTRPFFTFGYGIAEARINIAGGSGVAYNWPTWWLNSVNWPRGGEEDIVEVFSDGSMHTAYWSDPSGSGTAVAVNGPAPAGTWYGGFHTYAIRRMPGINKVYWDGTEVWSYSTNPQDDGAAQFLELTIGLHTGQTGHFGSPDGQMLVDYVRVWSEVAGSTQQNPTHTFATPGSYLVQLTATNAAGSHVKTATITVIAPPPPGTANLEAELATLTTGYPGDPFGARASTENPGYSGAGYIGVFGKPTEKITWTYTPPTASSYLASFRYRTVETGATRDIWLNGSLVGTVQTPKNANVWADNSWSTTTIPLTLNAGANTIEMRHTGAASTMFVDIDLLTLTPSSVNGSIAVTLAPATANFVAQTIPNNVGAITAVLAPAVASFAGIVRRDVSGIVAAVLAPAVALFRGKGSAAAERLVNPTVSFVRVSDGTKPEIAVGRFPDLTLESSVLKIGGVYQTINSPSTAQITAATEVFLGGHANYLTDAQADALRAAGYTVVVE